MYECLVGSGGMQTMGEEDIVIKNTSSKRKIGLV